MKKTTKIEDFCRFRNSERISKRAQITVFALSGILIVVIFGLFFYVRAQTVESELEVVKKDIQSAQHDSDFLKTYFENCLEKVSQNAVWLAGYQGGYVNPPANTETVDIFKVAIYANVNDVPEKAEIEEEIANYTKEKFRNCIDINMLRSRGFNAEASSIELEPANVNATINNMTITIRINQSVKISKRESKINLDSFIINIPVNLSAIHEKTKELMGKSFVCVLDLQNYAPNDNINVVDVNKEIIRFIDISTYYYFKSFIFQFAVPNDYILDDRDSRCSSS